jgi:hypothetical protein
MIAVKTKAVRRCSYPSDYEDDDEEDEPPKMDFAAIWKVLEGEGWWKIPIKDDTDPVYKAMNVYAELYVNASAKAIWTLDSFSKQLIVSGVHYFLRCGVRVTAGIALTLSPVLSFLHLLFPSFSLILTSIAFSIFSAFSFLLFSYPLLCCALHISLFPCSISISFLSAGRLQHYLCHIYLFIGSRELFNILKPP